MFNSNIKTLTRHWCSNNKGFPLTLAGQSDIVWRTADPQQCWYVHDQQWTDIHSNHKCQSAFHCLFCPWPTIPAPLFTHQRCLFSNFSLAKKECIHLQPHRQIQEQQYQIMTPINWIHLAKRVPRSPIVDKYGLKWPGPNHGCRWIRSRTCECFCRRAKWQNSADIPDRWMPIMRPQMPVEGREAVKKLVNNLQYKKA